MGAEERDSSVTTTSRISKVEVSIGKTINIGNYETWRIDIAMTANYKPGEFNEDEYDKLKKLVNRKVQEEVARLSP